MIINQATHRKMERKRVMEESWTNPVKVGNFNDTNGHNAMILCKLVNNVTIVWDSKFQIMRRRFGWSMDKKAFASKEKYEAEYKDKEDIGEYRGEVYSIVIVDDYKFLVPQAFLLGEINALRN